MNQPHSRCKSPKNRELSAHWPLQNNCPLLLADTTIRLLSSHTSKTNHESPQNTGQKLPRNTISCRQFKLAFRPNRRESGQSLATIMFLTINPPNSTSLVPITSTSRWPHQTQELNLIYSFAIGFEFVIEIFEKAS